MTLLSDSEQFTQLLAILHRGGAYGYWWMNPGKTTLWWPIGKPVPLPQGAINIYFGVNPTDKAKRPDERATIKDIAAINCVYGDFDAKDYGGNKIAALAAIQAIEIPPSVIIDTGGGYQAYWLFDQAWALLTDDDRKAADSLIKRWVAYTHADDSVKDLSRILRVVGSRNQKYDDKPLVSFVRCDLTVRYSRDELIALLPPEPVKADPTIVGSRVRTVSTNRLKQWADGVIDRACEKILHAPSGDGSDYRVEGGKLAGGILHAGIYTKDEIVDQLMPSALQRSSDNPKETERNIRNGIEYGEKEPLEVPRFPTEQALILNAVGHACCPSCDSEVLRSKYPFPGTQEPGWYCPTCGGVMKWPAEAYTPPDAVPNQAAPKVDPATDKPTIELLSWHDQGITLRELQGKYFDPEVWIIENILPEGACLFAAKYKSKKSWLSLALGCAVSMDTPALGRLAVAQGRVLYLDLEGKQQRIQKRTRAMLGVHHIPWPSNFHIFTKWPQGDAGMRQLEEWLKTYPDTRLVIIDVLNDFRRPMDRHEQFYQYDRDTVQPINELLERYHCAGLLVHHFNKTKGNTDIFDSITGSTGLPSAVNTMWGFERDVNDSSLTKFSMRGRDLEHDEPLALKWDEYETKHVIEGPAAEVATSGERREILDILDDDQPRSPKEIAEELNKTANAIKMLLRKLVNEGLVDKSGYGKYARIRHSGHTDNSRHSGHSGHSLNKEDSKSVQDDQRVSDGKEGGHSYTRHQDAANGKSVQSVHDSKGVFVSERIKAAGWTQERTEQGYRYIHPELGETHWHRHPYSAMDEADGISKPVEWDVPEGF